MSSVKSDKCTAPVMRWKEKAEHWSRQTGVPAPLLLAFIDQESDGRTDVPARYEPGYERTFVKGNPKAQKIMQLCRISSKECASSYGVLQVMFPLAYGYGARSIVDAHENSIRYGAAHIGNLATKLYKEGERYYGENHVKRIAGAYNGAGMDSGYARAVWKLYQKYNSAKEV